MLPEKEARERRLKGPVIVVIGASFTDSRLSDPTHPGTHHAENMANYRRIKNGTTAPVGRGDRIGGLTGVCADYFPSQRYFFSIIQNASFIVIRH